jgi:hypothetical protein
LKEGGEFNLKPCLKDSIFFFISQIYMIFGLKSELSGFDEFEWKFNKLSFMIRFESTGIETWYTGV